MIQYSAKDGQGKYRDRCCNMEPSGAIQKQSVKKKYGARWCYNMEQLTIEILSCEILPHVPT